MISNDIKRRWRKLVQLLFISLLVLFVGSVQANQQSSGRSDFDKSKHARAFAAPSGPNAIDEISLDGERKTFIKIGGVRDGLQKAIFDEAGEAIPPDFDNENHGRDFGFGTYDDNSVVDSRQELPLFIPPLYRNETEEEILATATIPEASTTTSRSPPPLFQPALFTRRPLIAQEVNDRLPIPVRTTPPPGFVAPFIPNAPLRPQSQQLLQQTRFVSPLSTPQIHAPAQTITQQPIQQVQRVPQFQLQQQQPSQQQIFIPRRPQPSIQQQQVFRPQVLPQQFIPQQQQQSFIPQQQQQFFIPQQQQQSFIPQQQQQSFIPQQQQRPEPRLSLVTRQPPWPQQPNRNVLPFQTQNNFVEQQPQRRPFAPNIQEKNLRTGMCPNTIFYESAPAASFDLHLTYSHFATVISVDQCARTCHEFNCASALFDPSTRRCQFNPTTVFSVPQGTCPLWPNPLYRNNVPITGQPLKIFCVTCQRRRRNGHRPVIFRTTNRNHFDQRSLSRTIANTLHGVPLEHSQPVITDKLLSENLESINESKNSDVEIESGPSLPDAIRTTMKPSETFAKNLEVSAESTRLLINNDLRIPQHPKPIAELRILSLSNKNSTNSDRSPTSLIKTINGSTSTAKRLRRMTKIAAP